MVIRFEDHKGNDIAMIGFPVSIGKMRKVSLEDLSNIVEPLGFSVADKDILEHPDEFGNATYWRLQAHSETWDVDNLDILAVTNVIKKCVETFA